MNSRNFYRGLGELLGAAGLCLVLGCPFTPPPGVCDQQLACAEGQFCSSEQGEGVCIWGQRCPNTEQAGAVIAFKLLEGALSESRRTNSALKLQVDVYGAPGSTQLEFAPAHLSQSCVESHMEDGGQWRQWQCAFEAKEEGDYGVKVSSQSASCAKTEAFAWAYAQTPPPTTLVAPFIQSTWWRSETFYVQLKAEAPGMDWEKSKLYFGSEQSAVSQAIAVECPPGFSTEGESRCFEVRLAELPHLPQGRYPLTFTAQLVDDLGNKATRTQEIPLDISYLVWRKLGTLGAQQPLVLTQKGWLILDSATQIVALNAQTEKEEWTFPLDGHAFQWNESVPWLLGNHLGTPVLLMACSSNSTGAAGLYALNAHNGESMTMGCAYATGSLSISSLAILKGGPKEGLVVAQNVTDAEDRGFFSACRLEGPEGNMTFDCQDSSKSIVLSNGPLAVQANGNTFSLYSSSAERPWFFLDWASGTETWLERHSAPPVTNTPQPIFGVGKNTVWGSNWAASLDPSTRAPQQLNCYEAITPWAIDVDETLIASRDDGSLIRLSAQATPATLLHSSSRPWVPKALFLVEGEGAGARADILLITGENTIVLLDADFEKKWTLEFSEMLGERLPWATLVPMPEQKRSVLFLRTQRDSQVLYRGILIDPPGLHPHAPWPMKGRDVCQSFNSRLSANTCAEGFVVSLL